MFCAGYFLQLPTKLYQQGKTQTRVNQYNISYISKQRYKGIHLSYGLQSKLTKKASYFGALLSRKSEPLCTPQYSGCQMEIRLELCHIKV